MTETVAPVTVQTRKPAVISPPLAGPNWLDVDSCCALSAHRSALNPLNGQLWGAERFAIDYVQLGPDGRIFTGDKSKPASYPYFGADIHAVADGPVITVVDGLPEQVAGKIPTGLPLDQYGGNHIVQDIGGGNYAFYAHLKTGSIPVQTRGSAQGRPSHRRTRQHRQHRCATPAFPCDEHTGPTAVRRSAVRVLLVHTERPARVTGCRRPPARGATGSAAAQFPRPRRNQCQPTGSRRNELCGRMGARALNRWCSRW